VKFTKVHSVDLIVEPGAGGGLDRLTEAAADHTFPDSQEGSQTMPLWKQRMLEAIKAKDPAKHAAIKLDTSPTTRWSICMKPSAARWCPSRHAAVTEAQGEKRR
jgi:hypothetical protein